jgi:hypothetical protein
LSKRGNHLRDAPKYASTSLQFIWLSFPLSHGQSDKFKKLYPAQYVGQEEISQNQEKDIYGQIHEAAFVEEVAYPGVWGRATTNRHTEEVFIIFQPLKNDECEPK